MSSELEHAVPTPERAEDAGALVSKFALSLIPVGGQIAVETLTHVLKSREDERR